MPALSAKNLRAMMSSHVGVVREGKQLAEAVRFFANLERDTGNIALRNMATTALLVSAAAWARRESRGAHFRSDFTEEKSSSCHRTMTTLDEARNIADRLAERSPTRAAQSMIA